MTISTDLNTGSPWYYKIECSGAVWDIKESRQFLFPLLSCAPSHPNKPFSSLLLLSSFPPTFFLIPCCHCSGSSVIFTSTPLSVRGSRRVVGSCSSWWWQQTGSLHAKEKTAREDMRSRGWQERRQEVGSLLDWCSRQCHSLVPASWCKRLTWVHKRASLANLLESRFYFTRWGKMCIQWNVKSSWVIW